MNPHTTASASSHQRRSLGIALWPAPVTLLVALVILGFVLGGGSRDDILSLLIWRPLSAVGLALAIAWSLRDAWRNGRPLLIYAGAVVGLILLHLLPLPPSLWSALPGRDLIVEVYRDMGMALPWQPISVAQARTWNALFSTLGPLAVLILALSVGSDGHRLMLRIILVIGIISAMLGLLQAIGPLQGPLYFYRITNNGFGVGLFSNRNHQALFIASMFPLLAAYLSLWSGRPERWVFQRVVVSALALFLIPLLMVTGSRAGAVLGLFGLVLAWWVYHAPTVVIRRVPPTAVQNVIRVTLIGSVVLGMSLLTVVAARAPAVTRLISFESQDEIRVQALPAILEASMTFFPIGSGIGTFVETYRMFEPSELLSPQYLNHAHNDYLEVLMTAGLPGVALVAAGAIMVGFAFWRIARTRIDRPDARGRSSLILARAGLAVLALLALGSISDYPLRVPSLALLAAVCAAWSANGCRRRSVT